MVLSEICLCGPQHGDKRVILSAVQLYLYDIETTFKEQRRRQHSGVTVSLFMSSSPSDYLQYTSLFYVKKLTTDEITVNRETLKVLPHQNSSSQVKLIPGSLSVVYELINLYL